MTIRRETWPQPTLLCPGVWALSSTSVPAEDATRGLRCSDVGFTSATLVQCRAQISRGWGARLRVGSQVLWRFPWSHSRRCTGPHCSYPLGQVGSPERCGSEHASNISLQFSHLDVVLPCEAWWLHTHRCRAENLRNERKRACSLSWSLLKLKKRRNAIIGLWNSYLILNVSIEIS